jgi:LysM repeat protein
LYSISRLYGISVTDLKALNRLKGNELEIGKVLIVKDSSAVAALSNAHSNDASVHIVGSQETLYSISREYDVSLDDIKQWNQLTDNNVRIGDTLWLKIPEKSMVEAIEQDPPTNKPNRPEIYAASMSSTSGVSQKNLTAVTELGIAAVIDGASDTEKYLALHPTAPVGTIMRVRNEMTNLSVFVRVVGKLPATGANNNVLIRLSQAAQSALGALDEKFRVEISYVPSQ